MPSFDAGETPRRSTSSLGLKMRAWPEIMVMISLISAGLAAASEDSTPILIPPLSVQRPAGSSWQIIRQSDTGVTFQRAVIDAVWSVAYVQGFESQSSDDPAAFLTEVKTSIASHFVGGPNAKVVSYSLNPTGDRGYPCVLVRSTIELSTPQTQMPVTATKRQGRILFCRLHGKEHIGFAVGFTYTAEVPLPASELEADTFLNRVGVIRQEIPR